MKHYFTTALVMLTGLNVTSCASKGKLPAELKAPVVKAEKKAVKKPVKKVVKAKSEAL